MDGVLCQLLTFDRAFFLLPAPGERRTADDGDVAGDVVGGRAEPGRPVALVDGDNDDGGRARGHRGRHDPRRRCHRARLLRERQADDDGPRDGANGVQLPVRQREAGAGRLPQVSAHRDLLLLLPHADALHRPRALPQHRHGQLRVLLPIGESAFSQSLTRNDATRFRGDERFLIVSR